MGYLFKETNYTPEYIEYLNKRKEEINTDGLNLRNLSKVYKDGGMWCAAYDKYEAFVFTRKDGSGKTVGYVSFVDYDGDRATKLCICDTLKRAIKYCDNMIGKNLKEK